MTTAKPRPPLAPGETRAYPVLPLRDIVVFPHVIAPLFVGRKKSILALEEVMRSDTFILLATQKNASDDDPATEAIYEIGTLASVLQLLKLPDGTVKALVIREEEEDGQRVKVIVNAVLLVPSDKLDENTAAAISAVSQGPAGAGRIKMHNKLPALVALGKYLGMFDQRPQNSNVIYAISDEPMSAEEWKKQFVKAG